MFFFEQRIEFFGVAIVLKLLKFIIRIVLVQQPVKFLKQRKPVEFLQQFGLIIIFEFGILQQPVLQ